MAVAGLSGSCARAAPEDGGSFKPEAFGAKGDGVTNDSAAFARLGAAVTAHGGGIVELRPTTYLVGEQTPDLSPGGPSFRPAKLLEIYGCKRPLVIRGNGARLLCATGLRYGIFDARTGRPVLNKMPYIGPGYASPYQSMIRIQDCLDGVEVADLELDGNLPGHIVGGQYGDLGWQVPATGIALYNNHGAEIIRNVHAHHHALDGLLIDGIDRDGVVPRRWIAGLRSEYNGRQGCSIVGGRGYAFENCSFRHTGRSVLSSAPGAGVDIEAENGKRIRDLRFSACEFSNNSGAGMVADTGDSADIAVDRCSFIGTTNWSAWPNKPGMRFSDCNFVGALARAYGSLDPAKAAQFLRCIFRDDPRLAPGGKVYGGENPDRPLADLSDAKNVLFDRCAFLASHEATLPWSTGAIYSNCRMEQRSARQGYPRGRFLGRTTINGNVDLHGAEIVGEVVVNGRLRDR